MNHLHAWVEISKQAITHNIKQYKSAVGSDVILAPVVKSNAYGHDMGLVAHILEHESAVGYICVVSLTEALYLRKLGIKKPILVLSIIDADLQRAVEDTISLVMYDETVVLKLNSIAKRLRTRAQVHIKIDTGLSRAGLFYYDATTKIQQWAQLPGIMIEGMFTHFANSESAEPACTRLQIERFNAVISTLEREKIHIPLRHTSCSAAITAHDNCHFNFARLGIGAYGLWASPENKIITQSKYPHFTLKPALAWKTRIVQIKTIPAGSFVGYDLTYQTKRETVVALLPIGYWDGFDRGFSNNGVVLINNKLAPIIGRIAMNLSIVDITNVSNSNVGDEVVLLGDVAGLTAQDLAARIGTINYEVITRINPLLQRCEV